MWDRNLIYVQNNFILLIKISNKFVSIKSLRKLYTYILYCMFSIWIMLLRAECLNIEFTSFIEMCAFFIIDIGEVHFHALCAIDL